MASAWHWRREPGSFGASMPKERARRMAGTCLDHRGTEVEEFDTFFAQGGDERGVFKMTVIRLFTETMGER